MITVSIICLVLARAHTLVSSHTQCPGFLVRTHVEDVDTPGSDCAIFGHVTLAPNTPPPPPPPPTAPPVTEPHSTTPPPPPPPATEPPTTPPPPTAPPTTAPPPTAPPTTPPPPPPTAPPTTAPPPPTAPPTTAPPPETEAPSTAPTTDPPVDCIFRNYSNVTNKCVTIGPFCPRSLLIMTMVALGSGSVTNIFIRVAGIGRAEYWLDIDPVKETFKAGTFATGVSTHALAGVFQRDKDFGLLIKYTDDYFMVSGGANGQTHQKAFKRTVSVTTPRDMCIFGPGFLLTVNFYPAAN